MAQEPAPEVVSAVGDIPSAWYRREQHVGYTQSGIKLLRNDATDKIDALLKSIDDRSAWRLLVDECSGLQLQLSPAQVRLLKQLGTGILPRSDKESYDYDNFHSIRSEKEKFNPEQHEPKRRFKPSKYEAERILHLVRKLRRATSESSSTRKSLTRDLDIWTDNENEEYPGPNKPSRPSKLEIAGTALSYNAPPEYHDDERLAHSKSLRSLKTTSSFILDRFHRCLDLYLCPRVQKQTLKINPDTILPRIPELADMRPFPEKLALSFHGHQAELSALAIDDSGEFLASGDMNGYLNIWDVTTTNRVKQYTFREPITSLSWRPRIRGLELAVCVGNSVVLVGLERDDYFKQNGGNNVWSVDKLNHFTTSSSGAILSLDWHPKGDYVATVEESGDVCVHRASTSTSQKVCSTKKSHLIEVLWHPKQPLLYIATRNCIQTFAVRENRIQNKLKPANSIVVSMCLSSGGEYAFVTCNDSRLYIFDTEASSSPIKVLQLQNGVGLCSSFHRVLPLLTIAFASGVTQIFFASWKEQVSETPSIIPLKVLDCGTRAQLSRHPCVFHTTQPWVVSSHGRKIQLFTD
jgi:ribosome biogenesis protein ERB1